MSNCHADCQLDSLPADTAFMKLHRTYYLNEFRKLHEKLLKKVEVGFLTTHREVGFLSSSGPDISFQMSFESLVVQTRGAFTPWTMKSFQGPVKFVLNSFRDHFGLHQGEMSE